MRTMSSGTGDVANASRPQRPPFKNLEEELKHKLGELTRKLAEKDDWITGLTLQNHKLQKQFEEEAEGGLEHSRLLFHAEKDRLIAQTECAELALANGELRGSISDLHEELADAAARAAASKGKGEGKGKDQSTGGRLAARAERAAVHRAAERVAACELFVSDIEELSDGSVEAFQPDDKGKGKGSKDGKKM